MFAASKFTPTPRNIRKRKIAWSSDSERSKETVQVYCRISPLQDNVASKSCVTLNTSQEICINSESKGTKKDISYKFKHIFTPSCSQKEVFDQVTYPLLEGLLNGKNSLLVSYGITGSGKTYTLTGNLDNPGIIPRCLYTIFNSINNVQTDKYLIKSDKMNGFEVQTEEEALNERQLEDKLLRKTPRSAKKLDHFNFSVFKNDGSKVTNLNKNSLYAIFVSYVEIYNNNVYDLLDDTHTGNRSLQIKILREDPNHNMYVNGAVELEVKTVHEAFEILSMGKKRKKMADTNLNVESSRSHSIFNIRIAQLETVSRNEGLDAETHLTVSHISLIDLAGSERTNRTQNTGTRLKEASCINNSLMTLRTCLQILKENQQNNENKVVPYRENRLTYLFKNFFEGDGSVRMIVCVNPSTENLEENLHVLKFAEMTQEVKILKSEPKSTPVITRTMTSRNIITPAAVRKTESVVVSPKILSFVFDFKQPEECERSIEKVLKSVEDSKHKREELDAKINVEASKLRSRLEEIDKKELFNKANSTNLNKLRRQESRINYLETKLTRLTTEIGVLLQKNKGIALAIRLLETNKMEKQTENINQELKKHQEETLSIEMLARNDQTELWNISSPSQLFNTPPHSFATTMERCVLKRSKSVDEILLDRSSFKYENLEYQRGRKREFTSTVVEVSNATNPKRPKYISVQEIDEKIKQDLHECASKIP